MPKNKIFRFSKNKKKRDENPQIAKSDQVLQESACEEKSSPQMTNEDHDATINTDSSVNKDIEIYVNAPSNDCIVTIENPNLPLISTNQEKSLPEMQKDGPDDKVQDDVRKADPGYGANVLCLQQETDKSSKTTIPNYDDAKSSVYHSGGSKLDSCNQLEPLLSPQETLTTKKTSGDRYVSVAGEILSNGSVNLIKPAEIAEIHTPPTDGMNGVIPNEEDEIFTEIAGDGKLERRPSYTKRVRNFIRRISLR